MVWALWQSLQIGSSLSEFATWTACTLCRNCSSMPWWQRPQVSGTFLGLTLDSGSERGRTLWAVWQLLQVAVTVRPLLSSPLPWMLSV
jgi:hypothetical protein